MTGWVWCRQPARRSLRDPRPLPPAGVPAGVRTRWPGASSGAAGALPAPPRPFCTVRGPALPEAALFTSAADRRVVTVPGHTLSRGGGLPTSAAQKEPGLRVRRLAARRAAPLQQTPSLHYTGRRPQERPPSSPLNFIFNTLGRPPLEIHSLQLSNCAH